jgi:hypothetical protein
VVAVNGKNVTIASSSKLKNGTSAGSGNATFNLEAGTMSTKYVNDSEYFNGPIIAGGLGEGDAIPPLGYLKVNQTKVVVYFGVSRTVNIVNTTFSDPQNKVNVCVVYDQISGMMLEYQYENNQTGSDPKYIKYGTSVIETNLFGSVVPEFSSVVFVTIFLLVAFAFSLLFGKELKPRRNLDAEKDEVLRATSQQP